MPFIQSHARSDWTWTAIIVVLCTHTFDLAMYASVSTFHRLCDSCPTHVTIMMRANGTHFHRIVDWIFRMNEVFVEDKTPTNKTQDTRTHAPKTYTASDWLTDDWQLTFLSWPSKTTKIDELWAHSWQCVRIKRKDWLNNHIISSTCGFFVYLDSLTRNGRFALTSHKHYSWFTCAFLLLNQQM